jgi:hypothetical protein
MRLILFCIFFTIILQQSSFSQEIAGKIISSEEAENLFGPSEKTYKMKVSVIKIFAASSDYLYFNFTGAGPVITSQGKKLLYPADYQLKGDEIFYVYSTSLITELINNQETEYLLIEKRRDVLTITNGTSTLEYAMLCPPHCY